MAGLTGASTPVYYYWEENFNQSPSDSTAKALGGDAVLETDEGSNEAVRVMAPDSSEAADVIERNFDGRFSATWTLTNPWWLQSIFGAPSSSGSDPTTHTYDGETPDSFQLWEGFRGSTNARVLSGCVPGTLTVTSTVPEKVSVTLEGAYAQEEHDTADSLAAQPSLDFRAYKFAEAKLSVDSTKVGYVQDATLTVTLNTEMINALDDRFPVDFWYGNREPDVEFSKVVESGESELETFYGGASTQQSRVTNTASLDFEFDNGETGADKEYMKIALSTTLPDRYGHDGMGDPGALVQQQLSRMGAGVTAEAQNGTASAP